MIFQGKKQATAQLLKAAREAEAITARMDDPSRTPGLAPRIERIRNREIDMAQIVAPSFYALHDDVRHELHTHYWLKGGRGSGKSSFVGAEIPLGMMRDAENGRMTHAVAFRRYSVNLKDSVFEQLAWGIEELGATRQWKLTVSPLRMIFLPTGQRILFRGVDEIAKIKSIKTRNGYIKYAWFEEADEFEGEDKIQSVLQSVNRGGSTYVNFFSFNPPRSARRWINQYCAAVRRGDTAVHHSTYEDVPRQWLGERFIDEAEYRRTQNPTAYAHEYGGLSTGTGGEIFDNIVAETITDKQISEFDRVLNGLDWGYYPDPFALNRMHYDAARRILYIFAELTMYKAGNRETADATRSLGIAEGDRITADSAEPKSVQDYRGYGLSCRGAIKGPGSVEYGMKWLQSLAKIVIDTARCPDTYREFSLYEHDRARDGAIIDRYPDRDDHHIAAVRYATERIWRRRGQ